MTLVITQHPSRFPGQRTFFVGRTHGAAFFGYSMREVIRKEQEWLLKNAPVGESRPARKPYLKLVASN